MTFFVSEVGSSVVEGVSPCQENGANNGNDGRDNRLLEIDAGRDEGRLRNQGKPKIRLIWKKWRPWIWSPIERRCSQIQKGWNPK
jgi:hypothetical protein